jgi:hypothetical protein
VSIVMDFAARRSLYTNADGSARLPDVLSARQSSLPPYAVLNTANAFRNAGYFATPPAVDVAQADPGQAVAARRRLRLEADTLLAAFHSTVPSLFLTLTYDDITAAPVGRWRQAGALHVLQRAAPVRRPARRRPLPAS